MEALQVDLRQLWGKIEIGKSGLGLYKWDVAVPSGFLGVDIYFDLPQCQ